jgi:hypothetical protein
MSIIFNLVFKTAPETVARRRHALQVHVYCYPPTGLAHYQEEEETIVHKDHINHALDTFSGDCCVVLIPFI